METPENLGRNSSDFSGEAYCEEDFRVLEAVSRIKTVDGIDFLDGVALPNDSDKPYRDEELSMDVTELYSPDTDGKLGYRTFAKTFRYPMTHQDMRKKTIKSLANGFGMVYTVNGSNYFIGLDRSPPRESRMQRIKHKITSALFGERPE